MGLLFYGNTCEAIEIPDRLLAHIKVVIATKLRRSESFTLSWKHVGDMPSGRSTIWLQPSIPLRFVFSSESETLDPELLSRFAVAANSSQGLIVDLEMLDKQTEIDPPKKTTSGNTKKTPELVSAA